MRAGTYIKYVATCLPTALIGIGIFLAIFRANPHLGLYSGIAALIVWALTMAGLARALQEVGGLVKVGDDVVAKADQAKPTSGKAKAAPNKPEAALSGSWFKRRERGFPRWMPYLFDLVAAIPAAAGLVAGVAFFSGQSASLTTMAALMLTCILYVSWRQQAFKTV